jgi:hypothetical protein
MTTCTRCDGTGKTIYRNRGGVCFKCWGTGDSAHPGTPDVITSRFEYAVSQDLIDRHSAQKAEATATLGYEPKTVGEIEAATGREMDWF